MSVMFRKKRKNSKSIFAILFALITIILNNETASFASNTYNIIEQPNIEKSALAFPAYLGGVRLPLETKERGRPLPELSSIFMIPDEIFLLNLENPIPNIDTMSTSAIVKGVFGSVAIPMSNFPVSSRWRPIFQKISLCVDKGPCLENSPSLQRIIQQSRGMAFRDKLSTINKKVNELVRYKADRAIYGVADHWATPDETLARGVGDCEDFAILKMAGLSHSGIPMESMSLVILQDRQRRVFHAVLSVYTNQGTFILDNLSDRVLLDTELVNYIPLYSLSTNRAWIHGVRSAHKEVAAISSEFRSIAPGEGVDTTTSIRREMTLIADTGKLVLRQGLTD